MIIEWEEVEQTETGTQETTDLDVIDIGLGNHIVRSLHKYRVTSNLRKDVVIKSFFERPASEKLFVGEYEDPKRFLRSLMGSSQSRKSAIDNEATQLLKDRINKRALPIVYFYRHLDFRVSDPSMADIPRKNAYALEDALIDEIHCDLDYSIFVLAFDKYSLGRVIAALVSSLTLDEQRFDAKTVIAGVECVLNCRVNDTKSISFENMSVDSADGRLLASKAVISVTGQLVRYRNTTSKTKRFAVKEIEALR